MRRRLAQGALEAAFVNLACSGCAIIQVRWSAEILTTTASAGAEGQKAGGQEYCSCNGHDQGPYKFIIIKYLQ